MACDCHKSSGNRYEGRVRPEDQCMACTRKHLLLARNAWGEFCHEDENREYVAAHIRAAIDHSKRDHREFAIRLRELAQTIEGVKDAGRNDVADRLGAFVAEAREMYYADNPSARKRMDALAMQSGKVDVILPLGKDSYDGQYAEARMLLRSIAANALDIDRVIVATTTPPRWLRNCIVVPIADDLKTNKDGNMLTKVIGAAEICRSARFCVVADDNAFIQPLELGAIPPIQGGGNRQWFEDMPEAQRNNWTRREIRTYDFFLDWGLPPEICFDTPHAPQTFTWSRLAEKIKTIPYREGLGYGVYSCLHLASGETDGRDWRGWVVRAQNEKDARMPFTVPLLSYNDNAWAGGIRARLEAMFPDKCRYEE